MRALWKYVFLHQSSLYIQKKSHPAVLGEKKKNVGISDQSILLMQTARFNMRARLKNKGLGRRNVSRVSTRQARHLHCP